MQSYTQTKYDTLLIDYMKQLNNKKYLFEITKCCDYSTIVAVNKDATLIDIYKEVSMWFECCNIQELYTVSNITNEKRRIPVSATVPIKQYLEVQPREFFQPIYPVPNNVVYRLYLDDGHHTPHT